MEQLYPGMMVEDATGPIGVVHEVVEDATTGKPHLVVQRHDGQLQTLSPSMYTIIGNLVRSTASAARATHVSSAPRAPGQPYPSATGDADQLQFPADIAPGEELRIPVLREEAVVRTRKVDRGGVRVHKTVNAREEVIEHPIYREAVEVERIPIGRIVEVAPEVHEEGDTLIIPVLEEQLVVEKRLVLKEEIRITRRRTEATEQGRVVLREEQAMIEDIEQPEGGAQG